MRHLVGLRVDRWDRKDQGSTKEADKVGNEDFESHIYSEEYQSSQIDMSYFASAHNHMAFLVVDSLAVDSQTCFLFFRDWGNLLPDNLES
jgi:hypothetical protein